MAFIGAKPTNVPLTSADLEDNIITSAKIVDGTIATSDISDGAVTSVKTTGVGGTNTPAFKVRNNSDQSLTNSAYTKLTLDTEVFDTDNAFASDKFTVPSGKDGKYYVSLQFSLEGQNDIRQMNGYIYKNGSIINDTQTRLIFSGDIIDAGSEAFLHVDGILDLAVSDYIEAYVRIYNNGGGIYVAKAGRNFFQGYRLIE